MTTIGNVAVSKVVSSPTQPRKRFEGLEELTESVKQYGVLQAILVRPIPDGHFECVSGERRVRAAKAAKLETIPAVIRELTDDEVIEAQIIENTQRRDLHPLEEAATYAHLHEKLHLGVEEIAAMVGKSKETIYGRMKLCSLCETGRKALLDGKLAPAVATLVARIPHEKLQVEATKKLLEGSGPGEPYSFRQASEIIQRDYMLRLCDASFDVKDGSLITGAGACTECPKRSDAQPELFHDVGRVSACTDPLCFALKRDYDWQQRVEAAKRDGRKVMGKADAKDVFLGNLDNGYMLSGYIDLDDPHEIDGRKKTVRAALKLAGEQLDVTLARNPKTGTVHELVERKAFDAFLRKQRREQPSGAVVSPVPESASAEEAAARREERKRELERLVDDCVRDETCSRIALKGPDDVVWRLLFDVLWEHADRSEAENGSFAEAYLNRAIPARVAKLVELCLEVMPPGNATLAALAKSYDVDVKAIEAQAKGEQKAQAKLQAALEKSARKAKEAAE